nr:isochorismatase family cysteine hydrolase [Brevundimonas diminuta]
MVSGIHFGPIAANAVHLCVDMQRLFAEDTAWRTPWMARVLPVVVRLCERKAERTCFTRFIPARSPREGEGTWRRYWRRLASMTLENLGEERVELLPELQVFTPPARVLDKSRYSPWLNTGLASALMASRVDTLVVTGAETDMCVLATVLGAVDMGFRVVVVSDALCSSSDQSHDALLALYHDRFGQQIETAECDEVLEMWA